MALSIAKPSRLRTRRTACPHCGPSNDSMHLKDVVELALGVLAGTALVLILIPLAIIAWKACIDFRSDGASHSILYHPLEDWTRY